MNELSLDQTLTGYKRSTELLEQTLIEVLIPTVLSAHSHAEILLHHITSHKALTSDIPGEPDW